MKKEYRIVQFSDDTYGLEIGWIYKTYVDLGTTTGKISYSMGSLNFKHFSQGTLDDCHKMIENIKWYKKRKKEPKLKVVSVIEKFKI